VKQADLDDLRSATTEAELFTAFMSIGNSMGFGLGTLGYRAGRLDGDVLVRGLGNPPAAWRARHADLQLAVQDPVFTRLQYSREPFLWGADTYANAGVGPLWEEGAPFDYFNGVAASLHIGVDRTIFWGFDRREPLPRDDSSRLQLLAMNQLIGVFAASTIERLMRPRMPVLTEVQLEVLQHARQGRSSWVIGTLMGIREDTVNYHLKRCRAALGVRTRLQAIQKAVELGLID